MPMFPCLNTSTIQPVPLSEKLKLIAQVGFRHVELWNDEIDLHLKTTGETLQDIHKRLQDHGLQVCSIIAAMGWAEAADSEVESVFDECRRRCEQATEVGSNWIVASPPMGPIEVVRMQERLIRLMKIAESYQIKLVLEFLGFTEKYKSVQSVLDVIHEPSLNHTPIVGDIYHLVRGGGRLEDLLLMKPGQLGIFHINDLPADPPFAVQTDHDRVMLGDGLIDLTRSVALLKQIQFEGPVSLELFNKRLWQQDPLRVLQTGFDRLTALIG
ncbi:MAG: sugar phosphate isomerase/epimerase [Planctomycetota bacterium]|nr:sugar phosphate isomerase/epimerase [Planctomycetota bacterium]RLS24675.1 MAG: sugar phosphate isomerase/epimerase [Planctomycetota bacterium]